MYNENRGKIGFSMDWLYLLVLVYWAIMLCITWMIRIKTVDLEIHVNLINKKLRQQSMDV